MAREEGPPPFDEFDARLERLRGRADAPAKKAGPVESRTPWGSGIQVGIELVAGLAGGLLLGWALDSWLGTAPWLLVAGFVLGAAAGVRNAWRWMQRFERRMREGSNERS
ncbi:MAG: AtpZ/AtpI family protein [Geminicoccaceae bacterium]|nr:AtpZ/AtpI family protein [Geminicoccaceae bacterium]MCX7630098.1 AtpZ/AtpI family protein [Geminicoccaceae bacterium]MDW8124341.1 AtpZ/AtpI family protein [Geminicoccaceae bacterium]